MKQNLKEVLDTQEFNHFISLLKDIAPYQLKIDKANGCIEILKKEERQIFQQLKKS
ncbi:hypothetical protein QKW52_24980 [Bacillus sonorensis]|nr:hypothetical protein [Bacillus sonorensis]